MMMTNEEAKKHAAAIYEAQRKECTPAFLLMVGEALKRIASREISAHRKLNQPDRKKQQ